MISDTTLVAYTGFWGQFKWYNWNVKFVSYKVERHNNGVNVVFDFILRYIFPLFRIVTLKFKILCN